MFYYSYFINENSPVKKPSVDDYKMLYNYLPLDVPYVVANDRQHAGEINNYLVPTKSAIKLYAKTPISDKNLIDELSFDGGYIINGSISPNEFDRIVETIRCFETRRNLNMMVKHEEGHDTMEFGHIYNTNSFDITTSNRMAAFYNTEVNKVKSKPNYKVSESFLNEFYGADYKTYVNDRNNTITGLPVTIPKINVTSIEEWNIKVTNWINRNISELANLGFYATNFPDIIFFNSGFSTSTAYPAGSAVSKAFVPNSAKKPKNTSSIFNFFKKS